MKLNYLFGLIAALILGWVFWRGWEVLDKSGSFRTLTYAEMPPCRSVTGAIGAEDLQIDHAAGLVYVAAFDRRRYEAGDKATRGMIGVFSLANGDSAVTDITPAAIGAAQGFAPHGLSLFVGPDGKKTLAVVNHAGGERVEIFDLVAGQGADGSKQPRLQHRRTIGDPLFRSLNDVALIGPDAFYVTNDHHYPAGIQQDVENYLLLNATNVVYFDGTHARIAAPGLTYPNGINVSGDGKYVYVAETTDNTVRTYERDADSGALKLLSGPPGRVDLGFGVDNIDVAADGSLFVAGHPKLFALLAHFKHAQALSPSEVVRLVRGEKGWDVKRVLLDSGARISGLSIAAREGANLVLGPILGKDILVCPYAE
jgi:arylesterase/paraoxonase